MRTMTLIVCALTVAIGISTARADSPNINPNNLPTGNTTSAPAAAPGPAVPQFGNGWFGNSWINPDKWPSDLQWLNPNTWPFTLIPLPIVETDPNQGTTIGILPVCLFNDSNHHIQNILAPDVNYNTELGAGADFRFLSYPSADTQWYVISGFSQNIARHVDLRYETGRTRQTWWSFEGRLFFERDPTERFFGLGNNSSESTESNYTTEQLYGEATLGLNLSKEFQIALQERPRYVRIQRGALSDLPYIGTLFPTVKGLNGGSEVMNRLIASYDTRDSVDIPTSGGLAVLFAGLVDRRFGSSVSYDQIGGELRHYFPLSSRLILATHFYMQYTPAGNETPFWAMARLGGEESIMASQETLRGYGVGRYVDNNLSVGNIELRTRVYETVIFDTHGILELAPFGDIGRVFHNPDTNPFFDLHPVGGLGVRAIADPFVVGYIDFGLGSEGGSVFTGIDYPF